MGLESFLRVVHNRLSPACNLSSRGTVFSTSCRKISRKIGKNNIPTQQRHVPDRNDNRRIARTFWKFYLSDYAVDFDGELAQPIGNLHASVYTNTLRHKSRVFRSSPRSARLNVPWQHANTFVSQLHLKTRRRSEHLNGYRPNRRLHRTVEHYRCPANVSQGS